MTLQSEHFMKYRNAGVYAEKLKMTYCGVDCCKECRRIGDCGGCEACKGHPLEEAVSPKEMNISAH